jgi:glycyl-tRNA synthetase beta chain
MSDFLLEIGTEEIPARMIASATDELQRRILDLVTRERLASSTGSAAIPVAPASATGSAAIPVAAASATGSAAIPVVAPVSEAFSSPRRIAVLVRGLVASQPDVAEQLLGPAAAHAYKDGAPTQAAIAFAKKVGVSLAELTTTKTPKGDYLAANVVKQGRPALAILSELVPKEIAALYWAKSMYWRPGKPERFVRPIRWLVALLDDDIVPIEFGGITAGRTSRGHRILTQAPVTLASPADYAEKLRDFHVLPSYSEREHKIRKALDAAVRRAPAAGSAALPDAQRVAGGPHPPSLGECGKQTTGLRWREDKELLDTVVNLTEAPSVILGNFDSEFLALPEEVLVTVMRDHQKYFAVEDADGKLAPHFLAVLNTVTDAEGEAIVRHGNERVLRARFNDARFFWNIDQKLTLKDRVAMLKSVTFQKELGSYYDKATRTQHLGSQLSSAVTEYYPEHRQGVVYKAALMAKCDLTTELVKEFTELQGVVGGLYLVHQAERMELPEVSAAAIGQAIYDQYKPASMEDAVPRSLEGAILAIADKADTIAGMFALGMIPSGSKDPFALRRAANGIVRILIEHNIPISFSLIMADALRQYQGSEAASRFKEVVTQSPFEAPAEYSKNVAAFFRERLEFYLRDACGFAYDVTNAVLASAADNAVDALARARAVAKVRGSEDFDAISASVKRIKNILRQATEAGKWTPASAAGHAPAAGSVALPDTLASAPRAESDAESVLASHTAQLATSTAELCRNKQYDEALAELATIRRPLDDFFDKVMVMVEDDALRNYRLCLLQTVASTFQSIADFSEVVTGGKA